MIEHLISWVQHIHTFHQFGVRRRLTWKIDKQTNFLQDDTIFTFQGTFNKTNANMYIIIHDMQNNHVW